MLLSPNAKSSVVGSGLFRAVTVLVGGAAVAHAITALAMPVLSRIYTPADFGLLAVYTAIVTTVGVAACLRFDVAVALPESDDDGVAVLVLSLISSVGVSLVAALIVGLAFDQLSAWINEPDLAQAKWLIPLGIFSAAIWSALQNWQIRKSNFGMMAKARLAQSSVTVASQIGAGMSACGALGLLVGPPLGFLISGVLLIRGAGLNVVGWLNRRQSGVLLRMAYEYRRFPAYSTWESLFNQAAIQLPIILIAAATTASEAGNLMLALYVSQAPMALLGTAIGQAYLSRAPQAFRDGSLAGFTNEVLVKLVKVGAGPIVALGIASPVIFPIVFGSAWERSGWLVMWMTPWFVLQFVVSPISMALHVVGAQRMAMLLQLLSLMVRLGGTWVATQLATMWVAEVYALTGFIVYFIYLLVIKFHLGSALFCRSDFRLMKAVRWVFAWAIGALAAVYLAGAIFNKV